MKRHFVIACLVICTFSSFQLLGQFTQVTASTVGPWTSPGHDYVKALQETITPADGQVSLRIDFPMPLGRQFTMPFQLAYDSNGLYSLEYLPSGSTATDLTNSETGSLQWIIADNPLGAGGWAYTLPYSNGPVQQTTSSGYGSNPQTCTSYTNWSFFDTTGGKHILRGLTTNNGNASCLGEVRAGGDYYFGGSVPSHSSGASQGLVVYGSSAEKYDFTNTMSGLATRVEDRNGNYLTLQQSQFNAPVTITDTVGRPAALTLSGLGTTSNTVALGSGLSYTITWTSVSYTFDPKGVAIGNSAPGCAIPTAAGSYLAIQSISLPNGTSYSFTYDNGATGLLRSITYPTGATVGYVWGRNPQSAAAHFQDPSNTVNQCTVYYDKPAIVQRTVTFNGSSSALTQSFSYNVPATSTTPNTQWSLDAQSNWLWTSKTTTVTNNDEVQNTSSSTVYTYLPGIDEAGVASGYNPMLAVDYQFPLENTITTTSGSNGAGTTLQTVTKTWNSVNGANDAQEIASEQVATGGLVKYTDYSYPRTGGILPIRIRDYAFGSGSHGGLLREADRSYLPNSSGPENLPCEDMVLDGSGLKASETDYYYDDSGSSSLCQAPGPLQVTAISAVQHDEAGFGPSSTTFRGNVAKIVHWSNNGASPTTAYSYDETGQVTSSTDPCGNASCTDMTGSGHTTTFSYADSYVAGTGTPPGATNAFLTQITLPANGSGSTHAENYSYRYSDGQVAASQDQNHQSTTYTYYGSTGLNRLQETDYPNSGKTTIAYNDAPPYPTVVTTRLMNTSGATEVSTSLTDGMGHTVKATLSDPSATGTSVDTTDTVYNGDGSVHSISNPYQSTADPTYGLTTYQYDALGRETTLTRSDGATLQWCYLGTAAGSTPPANCTSNKSSQAAGAWVDYYDEVGNHSQSISDALGRLTAVVEPDVLTNVPSWETDYQYDALNNLTRVDQWGGAAGSGSENSPRTMSFDSLSRLTSSTNGESGATSYVYDANGNLTTSSDSRNVTTYSYDPLNRLLSKTYTYGTPPSSCYVYDDSSVGNSNGRMTEEWTQPGACGVSSTVIPANAESWRMISTYSPNGLITAENQCPYAPCTTPYQLQYQYDLLGHPTSSTNGLPAPASGTPTNTSPGIVLASSYDTAGRVSKIMSNWSDTAHPGTLFEADQPINNIQPYGPFGLVAAQYGVYSQQQAALVLSRSYDVRERITSIVVNGNQAATVGGSSQIVLSPSPLPQGVMGAVIVSCDATCGTGALSLLIDGAFIAGSNYSPGVVEQMVLPIGNPLLTLGQHTLLVTYGGDTTHPAVSSAPYAFTIVPNTLPVPSVSGSLPQPEIVSGQYGEIDINVGCSAACGQGQWFVDGAYGGGFVLDNTGNAVVYTDPALAIGHHTVIVKYFGNGNYSSAASNPIDFDIVSADVSPITLTPSPVAQGVWPLFSVSCDAACGAGSTRLLIDGVYRGGGNYSPDVPTTFWLDPYVGSDPDNPMLAIGSHTLQLNYSGDSTHPPLSSEVLSFNVIADTLPVPVITALLTPATIPAGESSQISLNVGCASACWGGGYLFIDGNYAGGYIVDASGNDVEGTSSTLSVGHHTLTIEYFGDASYSAVTSTPIGFDVVTNNLPIPTITATLPSTPISIGSGIPILINVSCNTACGYGQLFIDGNYEGGFVLDANGNSDESWSSTGLSAGQHTLTVNYYGNTSYAPASSGSVTFQVTQ